MNALSDKHVLAVSERSAAVWEYNADPTPRAKARRSFVARAASHATIDGEGAAPGAEGGGYEASSTANAPQKDYFYGAGGISGNPRESTMAGNKESMIMGLGDGGEVKRVLNIKNIPDSAFTANTLMLPALEVRGSSGMNGMNMSQDKSMGSSSKPQYVLYCVAGHKLYAGTLPSYDKHNREAIHVGNSGIVDVSNFGCHLCTALSHANFVLSAYTSNRWATTTSCG